MRQWTQISLLLFLCFPFWNLEIFIGLSDHLCPLPQIIYILYVLFLVSGFIDCVQAYNRICTCVVWIDSIEANILVLFDAKTLLYKFRAASLTTSIILYHLHVITSLYYSRNRDCHQDSLLVRRWNFSKTHCHWCWLPIFQVITKTMNTFSNAWWPTGDGARLVFISIIGFLAVVWPFLLSSRNRMTRIFHCHQVPKGCLWWETSSPLVSTLTSQNSQKHMAPSTRSNSVKGSALSSTPLL